MTPPPTAEVLDSLKTVLAPTVGATAVTFASLGTIAWLLARRRGRDWRVAAPALAVLAAVAGLAAGNYCRGAFPWLPDGKWWHWVWPAVGFVLTVEFVARTTGVRNLLRGAAAGVVAAFLVPAPWQAEAKWWIPAAAGLLAMQWGIVDGVARRWPGGWVTACVAIAALGTATVLIHDKSLGRADVATMAFATLGTLAIAAWATRSDTGAAASAVAIALPAMLLVGWAIAYEPEVPRESYLLVGFAPSALGLLLVPGASRHHPAWKLLLVLIPVAVGIALAMHAVPDPFAVAEPEW